MEYTSEQIKEIIKEQFPMYSDLEVVQVVPGGHDNRTFRIGGSLSLRMPSSEGYANQVAKEFKYLPLIAPQLSIPITTPIHLGKESLLAPFPFTINKWIEGKPLTMEQKSNINIASDLNKFLKELQSVSTVGGSLAGIDNCYRGCNLIVYDLETRSKIDQLKWVLPAHKLLEIWERGLTTDEVRCTWIHGDMAMNNILISTNKVQAIIDFGQIAVGDPSCDYTLAWTLFDKQTRAVFLKGVNQFDIMRAKSWALWKALISIDVENLQLSSSKSALDVISRLLAEE